MRDMVLGVSPLARPVNFFFDERFLEDFPKKRRFRGQETVFAFYFCDSGPPIKTSGCPASVRDRASVIGLHRCLRALGYTSVLSVVVLVPGAPQALLVYFACTEGRALRPLRLVSESL